MSEQSRTPRPRLAIAIAGALLAASIAVILVIVMSLRAGTPRVVASSTTQPTLTASGLAGGAAHTAPNEMPTVPVATTASNSPAPAPPSGQAIDLHGVIESVRADQHLFTLAAGGTSYTIVVNASTGYEGAATTLAGLQSGRLAEVKSVQMSGTTYLAYDVHSDL